MDTLTDPAIPDAFADAASPQERFAALLERHRGIVLKVAHGYARDPEDRRDLLQDISVQAWRSFPGFDPARARFSTWLYRIALNTAISHVRSAELRRRHHAPLDDDAAAAVADPHARDPQEPDAHGHHPDDRTRTLAALHAAIARLDPLDRALALLYLDDCSHREIGQVLGLSESNVGTRLHRLRQRLRTAIEHDIFPEQRR